MTLRSRLDEFCRAHDLDARYVFGSRAAEVCRRIVLDRSARVDRMLGEIRSLPLSDRAPFLAESRNVVADEPFDIRSRQSGDLARIRRAYRRWMDLHPEMVGTSL